MAITTNTRVVVLGATSGIGLATAKVSRSPSMSAQQSEGRFP
jgi:short-subunit dehydrogenase